MAQLWGAFLGEGCIFTFSGESEGKLVMLLRAKTEFVDFLVGGLTKIETWFYISTKVGW